MATELGDKILNLAEDIVQFGVDPSSLPLIMATGDGTKHIVLEGNRRIVALKLLHNPTLTAEVWSSSQEKRLKELSQQFKKSPINSVQCVVVADREEADHWIQLRHPFAISVLFRVFFELSVDHYIAEQKLKTPTEFDQMTMRSKLDVAASNLQSKGGMTKGQANLLRSFGNPQKFLAASINNFHAYVHDPHFSAGPSDLIAAWDSLQPFFKKFWE